MEKDAIIKVRDLAVGFGKGLIIDGLDLDVYRGEVLGVVGGSGTGKSVLLRTIIGLVKPQRGSIDVLGVQRLTASSAELRRVEQRWGVLFQHGALFSSLTVKQNIQVPMREYLSLSQSDMDDLAKVKLEMVGLKPDAGDKFPSELSGGMIKRAAFARALALDPDIVFLDEPTSGLDPMGAAEFDDLVATLRDALGLTVFMVTHDLDSLHSVCDRIAALAEKRVILEGTMADMLRSDHPWLRAYFHGKRARAANIAPSESLKD